MKEIKLTGVIIAKNAENKIKKCIESLRFCDEILVVNAHSTDATVKIAKDLRAKVIEGIENDFAGQRNIGMRAANGEWIVYVDTDERVSKELAENIKQVIFRAQNPTIAFKLKRKNFYFGNHGWPKIEYLERLFKRSALKGWYGKLHETAQIEGQIGILKG